MILRNKSVGGDATSKIFEYKSPRALPEKVKNQLMFCIKFTMSFMELLTKSFTPWTKMLTK